MHILLVGDDAEYRVRLHRDLARYRSHLSVLHIRDEDELPLALASETPDIFILEDPWYGDQGIEFLRTLKQADRGIRALMLVEPGREAAILRAIGFGLDGHLLKTANHLELLADAVQALVHLPPAPAPQGDERSRVLMNRLNFGAFRATPRGEIIEGNTTFLRLIGIDEWEAVHRLRLQDLLPDDRMRDHFLEEVRIAGSYRAERLRLRRPDGIVLTVTLSAVLSHDDTREEDEIVGTVDDLAVAAAQEERTTTTLHDKALAMLGEEVPMLVWSTDADLIVRTLEGSGTEVLGRPPAELVGSPIGEVFAACNERAALIEAHEEALEGGSRDIECDIGERAFSLRVEPSREGGAAAGVVGVGLDVTRQSRDRRALEASENRYRLFFEEDLTADFIADGEGRLLACNPAFARLFGFKSPEEALRRPLAEHFLRAEDHRELFAELRREQKIQEREITLKKPDGAPIEVIANVVATVDDEDRITEVKGYLYDVTERKLLESELAQAQRLEAVGRLAGGVAHDFNNILTAINGYAALLLKQAEPGSPAWRSAQAIQKAGQQASSLTKQLMAFSRRQIMQPQAFALGPVIREMRDMLNHLLGPRVELIISTAEEEKPVKVDRNQIEQVVMNLVLNARDAMPEGGRLEIRTELVRLGDEEARQIPGVAPGSYMRMTVSDTGMGMDEETRSRIFEPFFTTKSEGEGTGLGLATAHGILTQSGGAIQVSSQPGEGTVFTVHLPLAETREERAAPPQPTRHSPRKRTILVAEDDENVLSLAEQVLGLQGHEVIACRSGSEAVRRSREHEGGIDLLLADVVMPDFSGRDLAEIMRSTRPELKVLFMSAHNDSTVGAKGVRPRGRSFIHKPFTPDELTRRIGELLGDASATEDAAEA